jgi:mono/diheme cytochrome c family protein
VALIAGRQVRYLILLLLFLGLGFLLLLVAAGKSAVQKQPSVETAFSVVPQEPKLLWEETAQPKISASADLIELGKKSFSQLCSQCHGPEGRGNGPSAEFLVTKPRDFTSGIFKFRTTPQGSPPADEDLFRTLTVGFPLYGMPSFRHLPSRERWALVYRVKSLAASSPSFEAAAHKPPLVIGGELPTTPASIKSGREIYEALGCTACHGAGGKGDGPSASDLKDEWGHRIWPLDFTKGKAYFKTGSRPRDIVRILMTGISGTPMPSFLEAVESPQQLWQVAQYVANLAEKGQGQRQREWANFFGQFQASFTSQLKNVSVAKKEENWDRSQSKRFNRVSAETAKEKGCLSCHTGIEDINDKMMPHLIALAGGLKGKSCALCHEGNPEANTKEEAHSGMFPNPGSMWVVSVGLGCGKCHSNRHALTTLHTIPLPHPVGGELMNVVSTSTDPSGESSRNHIYRMQRGLMGTEFGKASHTLMSNGVVPKGEYVYDDYNLDDPDGPTPTVGTDSYKQWIKEALDRKFIRRVEQARSIPNFDEGLKLWRDPIKASFSDMYRKECGRCHVWEEGRRERGDLRAGGCAACHVLYTNDGKYEGDDPTIPKDKGTHPLRHEITVKIPAAQCNHCHTRGKRIGTSFVGAFEYDYKTDNKATPWDEKGDPQKLLYTKDYLKVKEDVHFERGIQCMDCHTSIDVHGDGNIYPTTLYQVEIQCQDCHGTPDQYPWELPVGYGTPVELPGKRGTYQKDGKEYLFTARGNPRQNLVRQGQRVVLTSFFDGKEHVVPLLKEKKLKDTWKTEQGKVAMAVVSQHLNKLECYACHATWAPQCYGCHYKYDRRATGTDWVLTGLNHDPKTGKQQITKTPGAITIENRSFMRWEEPILGINLKGRVAPLIPGCQVFWSYVDEKGKIQTLNKIYKTSDGFNSPTLAPVQPHTNSIPARTCESCHANPKSIGYGTANSRSQGKLDGDKPMFVDMAEGFYGDIPGAKTGKWQVPKIPEFPYTLDQLVTRSGKQVQNMPHQEDRPLNAEERNKVEREGLCVACHRHYNTPLWEDVRKKVGPALTPEQHDRAVEEALKALATGDRKK